LVAKGPPNPGKTKRSLLTRQRSVPRRAGKLGKAEKASKKKKRKTEKRKLETTPQATGLQALRLRKRV